MPAPPPAGPGAVLRAVLDTRFGMFVTPLLVMWIYRACMALIAITTAAGMLLLFAVANWTGGWAWAAIGVILPPLGGLVTLLSVRVLCELVLSRWTRPVMAAPPAPERIAGVDSPESPKATPEYPRASPPPPPPPRGYH